MNILNEQFYENSTSASYKVQFILHEYKRRLHWPHSLHCGPPIPNFTQISRLNSEIKRTDEQSINDKHMTQDVEVRSGFMSVVHYSTKWLTSDRVTVRHLAAHYADEMPAGNAKPTERSKPRQQNTQRVL